MVDEGVVLIDGFGLTLQNRMFGAGGGLSRSS